ncbi:MAG: glycosyltransferase family 2 protein [Anaerolineales bacterium]
MTRCQATIVITTRDRPHLLARAVESALAQTLPDLEVVVVDDASSEPVRIDRPRLRVIRRQHAGGPCAARNTGLDAANGRWVTFLDDDDCLLPTMLERSIETAGRSALPPPVWAAWSAMQYLDVEGKPVKTRLPMPLPVGGQSWVRGPAPGRSFAPVNTLVAIVDVLRSIGGWDERIRSWEGPDLMLRLNQVTSIEVLEEVTYLLLDHPGERRNADLADHADGIRRTFTKHGGMYRSNRRAHAAWLADASGSYLRAGRWATAVAASMESVRADPAWGRGYLRMARAMAGPRVARHYEAARQRRRSRSACPDPGPKR